MNMINKKWDDIVFQKTESVYRSVRQPRATITSYHQYASINFNRQAYEEHADLLKEKKYTLIGYSKKNNSIIISLLTEYKEGAVVIKSSKAYKFFLSATHLIKSNNIKKGRYKVYFEKIEGVGDCLIINTEEHDNIPGEK